MRLRTFMMVFTLAAALLATGCGDEGGGPGGAAGDPAVFVTARDNGCVGGTDGFIRDAGATINVDFINERSEPATFSVQLDGGSELLHTETVEPGATARAQVKVSEAGNYVLGCGPGEQAGMRFSVNP